MSEVDKAFPPSAKRKGKAKRKMNMDNDTNNPVKVKEQSERFYLDPHFFHKAHNKGDLLQCFSKNGEVLTYRDLAVDRSWFAKTRKTATSEIVCKHGVPIEKAALSVFKIKSWLIILILLKLAIHKKMSVSKIKAFYKEISGKTLHRKTLFKMLSEQKVFCIQLDEYIVSISEKEDKGLFLSNGQRWQTRPTQQQLAYLAKATEKAAIKKLTKMTPTKLVRTLRLPTNKEEYQYCLLQIKNSPLTMEEKQKAVLILKKHIDKQRSQVLKAKGESNV